MKRDSFLFYASYIDAAHALPEDVRLWFYETIFAFAMTGEEPEPTGDPVIDMAFTFIRPLIKSNIKNYENGLKGGAPKGNSNNPNGRRGKNQPRTNRKPTQKQGNVTADASATEDVDATADVTVTVYSNASAVGSTAGATASAARKRWEDMEEGEYV